MATDVLVLGGLTFDDWATPQRMPFGGRHSAVVHKLPGGSRAVQTLGPDEMDIRFTGFFYGDTAYESALALNSLRLTGAAVPLMFAGQFFQVIVIGAEALIERFPQYVHYDVTCLVASNPMAGDLSSSLSSLTSIVGADMATAMSLAGL